MKLLGRLFSPGAPPPAAPADAVDYEGYTIVASPRQVQGGWSTEGTISRTIDGEERREHFIRADTTMSREDAIEFTRAKARKIIDEQGERLFSS